MVDKILVPNGVRYIGFLLYIHSGVDPEIEKGRAQSGDWWA